MITQFSFHFLFLFKKVHSTCSPGEMVKNKQNKKFSVLKDPVDFLLCKRKRESKKKKKSPDACKRLGEKSSLGESNLRAEAGSQAPGKPQFEHLNQTLASRCGTHTRPRQHKLNMKIAETRGENFPNAVSYLDL